MRFVWAVLAFVLATLLIGAGIAQRTVFLGPKTQQTPLTVEEPAAYTLIDGAVLRTQAGAQTLLVRGEHEIFAAYGRTHDLQAWLADAAYNAITVEEDGEIVISAVAPALAPEEETETEDSEESTAEGTVAEEAEADAAEEAPQPGRPGRDPAGSDLWLDEFTNEDLLIADMQLPEGMSVLIARDGVEDAPTDIVVSWPLDNSTPWAGPLLVAGGLLMAVGVVLYVLAIRFQRRGRGPRRKGPGPLPPTEPIDMELVRAEERAALTDGKKPETPATRRRRLRIALPALGMATVLLAGCSADSWPRLTATDTPSPSPSPTVIAPENQQAPAVTEAQAVRILQKLAASVAEADEARDAELLGSRMTGMPLAERTTNYTLRESIEDHPAPSPIPTGKIEILLPQASEGWPRTVLIVSEDAAEEGAEAPAPPVVLVMVQETPWDAYKISYLADTQAAAKVPELAPAWLGTQLIPPATPFLSISPEQVSVAFGDVVDKGEESEYYGLFDEAALALASSVQESRQTVVQGLADANAASTSQTAFSTRPTGNDPVALGTFDSGAIVAVDLLDTEQVTPTTPDAVIRIGENNVIARTLTGVSESAKGVDTRYSLQLFFAVPSQGSNEPVRLLAAHQAILSATVIQ